MYTATKNVTEHSANWNNGYLEDLLISRYTFNDDGNINFSFNFFSSINCAFT